MARPRTWRSLVPGLVTLGLGVAAFTWVLWVAAAGGLHGPTIELFVATDNATGVIRGNDVWHSGERIGEVEGTSLRPVAIDTSRRVLVRIVIRRSVAERIRRDTRVQIRPGSSMLGAPVVYLSGGSSNAPEVKNRDTLIAQPQSALDETRAAVAVAEGRIPELRADVESLTSQLFSRSGTIGAANTREADNPRVTVLDALTSDLKQRTRAAKPTVSLDSMRNVFMIRVQHALAASDSLRRMVVLPGGTLERLERDTAFLHAVRDTRAELDTTQRLLNTPAGTLGRMQSDSAIRRQLSEAASALDKLGHDASQNPSRYMPF